MITGNSSGEFTLWNGSAFNFETTKLFTERGAPMAVANVAITLAGCVVMGLLGMMAVRRLAG